jgi:hypothetical protein
MLESFWRQQNVIEEPKADVDPLFGTTFDPANLFNQIYIRLSLGTIVINLSGSRANKNQSKCAVMEHISIGTRPSNHYPFLRN